MDAKRCDRCGDFYIACEQKDRAITNYRIVIRRSNSLDKIIDLCPECLRKLEEFMNDPNAVVKGELR